jgi:hypothetical protein
MNIDKKIEKIVDNIEGGEAYGDPIVRYKGQDEYDDPKGKLLLSSDIKELLLEVQKETAREMMNQSTADYDGSTTVDFHDLKGTYKQLTGEDYES